MLDLSTISKAIAGGLVTLVVGYLAKYGVHITPVINDSLNTLIFALVFYAVGHLVVYIAPANKSVK